MFLSLYSGFTCIITQARTIFEKATKVNYKQVDDLAAVWCEYGEMELRHENYEQALRILRVTHFYHVMFQNIKGYKVRKEQH